MSFLSDEVGDHRKTGTLTQHSVLQGEISLRGRVTAVGGIKEKLIGALRAGVKTVLLPAQNRKDVKDLPQEVKDGLEILHVKYVFSHPLPKVSCISVFLSLPEVVPPSHQLPLFPLAPCSRRGDPFACRYGPWSWNRSSKMRRVTDLLVLLQSCLGGHPTRLA